jgi:uncharacterized protein YggU (UPF0235/DUF167 family)
MHIKVTVKASAPKDSVLLRKNRYHITTREPAQGGRANQAAQDLLAYHLHLSRGSLSLVRGKDRPSKIFLMRERE